MTPTKPNGSAPSNAGISLTDARLVLQHTPGVITALLAPLPPAWLDANEGPGTWSARQVVQHLVWGEVDDWIPRARIIKTHGTAQPFQPFDREEGFRRYADWSIDRLLAAFAECRAESLAALDAMVGPDDLTREGYHPELGIVTMAQLLATWVTHDLTHITQIGRVLTRHAGQSAGPWRTYFSLLRVTT